VKRVSFFAGRNRTRNPAFLSEILSEWATGFSRQRTYFFRISASFLER
jgi:hypothetical protein